MGIVFTLETKKNRNGLLRTVIFGVWCHTENTKNTFQWLTQKGDKNNFVLQVSAVYVVCCVQMCFMARKHESHFGKNGSQGMSR